VDNFHNKWLINILPILPYRISLFFQLDETQKYSFHNIAVARPFKTERQRTVFGVNLLQQDGILDRWGNNNIVAYEYKIKSLGFNAGIYHGLSKNIYGGIALGHLSKNIYEPYVKERRMNNLYLGISSIQRRYISVKNLNNFNRPGDITLGYSYAVGGTISDDPSNNFALSGQIIYNTMLNDNFFSLHAASLQSYYRRNNSLRFGYATPIIWNAHLIMNIGYSSILNGDDDDYYIFGSRSTLRGFPNQGRVGAECTFMNIETGFFPDLSFKTIKFSPVVFLDVLSVIKGSPSERYEFGGGFGIRMASSRSNDRKTIRFEIASQLTHGRFEPTYIIITGIPFRAVADITHFLPGIID